MQDTESLFDLRIDHESKTYLAELAKWGKFLAIVGFIMIGLLVLFSIFGGSILATMGAMAEMGVGAGFISFIYLALAALWFFPCYNLFMFSVKAQHSLRTNDQVLLNGALKELKGCFRFMGIMTIILLCIYALGFLLAIVTAIGTSL